VAPEQLRVLPGFAGIVFVVVGTVVVVVVLLVVVGAAGGVHVEAGCESQVFSMEVSAASSDVVTVSSHRVLMVAHVWAYTHQ